MQDGKFHPHTEYKKGTRKSRDQQVKTVGVRMARGDNNAEILKNRLRVFNNFHKPDVEYGTFGGGLGKALIIKGTQKPLSPNGITKSEAIDYLSAIDDYVDNLEETIDGTNENILTLQPTGKRVEITGSGDVIRKIRETSTDPRRDDFLKSEYWIENSYINHTIIGLEGTQNIDGDPMVKGHIQDAINSLKKAKKFQHEENQRMNG